MSPRLWPLVALCVAAHAPAAEPIRPVVRLGDPARRAAPAAHFTASPDGTRIARVRPLGTDVRDAISGEDITPGWLKANTNARLHFAPTGELIRWDADARRVDVLDYQTGTPRTTITPPGDRVPEWFQLSADGRSGLLTWSAGGANGRSSGRTVYAFEPDGPKVVLDTAPAGELYLSLAGDGRLLVASKGTAVLAFAADTGRLVRETQLSVGEEARYFVPFADGRHGVAVSDHRLRFCRIDPDGVHETAAVSAAGWRWPFGFDPAARAVSYWSDAAGGRLVRVDIETGAELSRTAWDADGRGHSDVIPIGSGTAAISRGDWGRAAVFDVISGRERFAYPDLPPLADARFADGRSLVTLSADRRLTWWEVETGRPTRTVDFPLNGRPDGEPRLSADGRRLAVRLRHGEDGQPDRAGEVRVFDLPSGTQTSAMRRPGEAFRFAEFSPDGHRLAAAVGEAAYLLDADSGRFVRRLAERATAAGWSADGRLLAAENGGRRVQVVEVRTGRPRYEIDFLPRGSGPDRAGGRLLFSREGRTLVRLGRAVRFAAWTLDDEARLIAESRPRGDAEPAAGADLSADGRFLLLADEAGAAVEVFDLHGPNPGEPVGRWEVGQAGLAAVRFSPSGDQLLTAAKDGTAAVWDWSAVRATFPTDPDPARRSPQALWQQLGDPDPRTAAKALAELARTPSATAALVESMLPPAALPSADRLRAWVKELDDDRYPVRANAARELARLGPAAEPALRAAAAGGSAELLARASELLGKLDQPDRDPDRLRSARAVELLERLGEAGVPALARLAGGHPAAPLTQDAKSALGRIGGR